MDQEMETQISNIAKFDITKAELEKIVKDTKEVTVEDLEDKNQLELVGIAKNDLRTIEIEIEKTGKSFRDVFTKMNKGIMAKQKELLAITNPEVERLKGLLDEAKEYEDKQSRIKLLPYRKEKLAEINVSRTEDFLLKLNDKDFADFLMSETVLFNQNEISKKEIIIAEREKALDIKKGIAEALENEKQKQVEDEKREKALEIMKEEAMKKDKEFLEFLSVNLYNEKDFHIVKENGEAKLYKYVATYTFNK